jgi:hypothetical protein
MIHVNTRSRRRGGADADRGGLPGGATLLFGLAPSASGGVTPACISPVDASLLSPLAAARRLPRPK